jgi:imidazolonepropionase-like amidohydrolase
VRILLRGGRVLGVHPQVPPGSGLLVDCDRILAILPPAEVASASADQVLDLEETTLLPGLIDAHVHLSMSAGRTHAAVWSDLETDTAQGALPFRVAGNAASALRAGITTIRDLGDHRLVSLALRQAAQRGLTESPSLLLAGAPLTTPGGHLHAIGAVARGVDQVRAAVRRLAHAGVDWIKVMASGGNMTPDSDSLHPQFTAAEMHAVVDEAHAAGKLVAAHALCTEAIRIAVKGGVDTIEHALWRSGDGRHDWDESTVELMAERGVTVTATLGGYLRNLLLAEHSSTDERAAHAATLDDFWAPYRRLRAAGVRVIAASDAGVRLTPIDDPAGMLQLLTDGFGLRLPEALELLTAEPALALRLPDRGWLGAGARADVLAVAGDLECDSRHLANVQMVMSGGQILRRPTHVKAS